LAVLITFKNTDSVQSSVEEVANTDGKVSEHSNTQRTDSNVENADSDHYHISLRLGIDTMEDGLCIGAKPLINSTTIVSSLPSEFKLSSLVQMIRENGQCSEIVIDFIP